jgi:hypothetical protein
MSVPLSMEAKIRAAWAEVRPAGLGAEEIWAAARRSALRAAIVTVSAVLTEAAVYATDPQDVPAQVAARLEWQLETLEQRAIAALEEGE